MHKSRSHAAVFFLVIAIVVVGCSFVIYKQHIRTGKLSLAEQKKLVASATTENIWVLSEVQGSRSACFYSYDATDEYVYFTYPEDFCVDVYNTEGVFQYTLYLPYARNGAVSVRCEDAKTYIKDHNSTIFVFEGKEYTGKICGADVEQHLPYHNLSETGIRINKEQIQRFSDDGTLLFQFATPDMIKATMPLFPAQMPSIWIFVVLGPFVAAVVVVIVKRARFHSERESLY